MPGLFGYIRFEYMFCKHRSSHSLQEEEVPRRSWVALRHVGPGWGHVGNLVSTLTLSQAAMHRLRQARQTLGGFPRGSVQVLLSSQPGNSVCAHKSAARPSALRDHKMECDGSCFYKQWRMMRHWATKDGHSVQRPCHLEQLSSISHSICSLPVLLFFPLPPSFKPFRKCVCFCLTPYICFSLSFPPQLCDSLGKWPWHPPSSLARTINYEDIMLRCLDSVKCCPHGWQIKGPVPCFSVLTLVPVNYPESKSGSGLSCFW